MYVDITNCTIHGYVIHIAIYVYQQKLQLLGWAFDQKKKEFQLNQHDVILCCGE